MAVSGSQAERSTSPLDELEGEPERRVPARRALVWTGVGVVVLAGAYVAGQWAVADKVPRGTTVAGVAVGGLSTQQAVTTLEEGLADRLTADVEVSAGEATGTLDPVAAGLGIDAAATVDDLAGFDLSPAHLWRTLFGGTDVDPVVTVDDAALDTELESVAQALAVDPVDGTVVFADGQVTATPAKDGQQVDVAAARERVLGSWLRTSEPIDLPVSATAPAVTQAATDAALEVGRAFVSAPVRVEVAEQTAEIPVSALTAAASFTPEGEGLALHLDEDAIAKAVLDRTKDLETSAADASFVFEKGKPVIKGGEKGLALDRPALAAAVASVATQPGDRKAVVELVEVDAEQSKDALEALGVKEVVAEFTTPLGASNAARIHNLTLGAKRVTGQLILPDETWSLTEALSPITAEGGYASAGIVSNGQLTEGVGGGLSQMATTTYNAGFLAGLEIVEHRPHSYYFSRYPEGREATIFLGSIDMRLKNDTPYGVLLQSFVKDGSVTVRAWSTKHFRVETSTSPRRDVVSPRTVTSTASSCIAQAQGSPGFAVTVTRKVYLGDEQVKDESNVWRYAAQNGVVCRKEPAATPKKSAATKEPKATSTTKKRKTSGD